MVSKSISPSCLGLLGLKLALPVSMWMRVRTSSSSERIFTPNFSMPSLSTRMPMRVMSASTCASGNSMSL